MRTAPRPTQRHTLTNTLLIAQQWLLLLHTTTTFYTILFVTFGLIGTIFTVVGLLWTPLMWIEIVDSCLKMKGMGASLTWTGRFVKGFIVFYFICFGIAVFSTIASVCDL